MEAEAKIDEPEPDVLVNITNSASLATSQEQPKSGPKRSRKSIAKSIASVPVESIEFAIKQLKEYVDFRENNDIDKPVQSQITEEKWQKLYEWFYAACQ